MKDLCAFYWLSQLKTTHNWILVVFLPSSMIQYLIFNEQYIVISHIRYNWLELDI